MKPKSIYLLLCLAGAILPYWQFLPWLFTNGLDLRLFVGQLFANRISAFFALDVFVSALVVFALVGVERKHVDPKWWWLPLPAVLAVGVSLGLPLFLYLREARKESSASPA
jgi:hypothetical protein